MILNQIKLQHRCDKVRGYLASRKGHTPLFPAVQTLCPHLADFAHLNHYSEMDGVAGADSCLAFDDSDLSAVDFRIQSALLGSVDSHFHGSHSSSNEDNYSCSDLLRCS